MPDPSPYPDHDASGAELESESARTPRWLKVSAIVALVVVLAVVVMLVVIGGHGPSRH